MAVVWNIELSKVVISFEIDIVDMNPCSVE